MPRPIDHSKEHAVLNLIRYFQSEEACDPTYDDLTFYCQAHPRTIAKILRRLEAFDVLRIERRRRDNDRIGNHYIIQE